NASLPLEARPLEQINFLAAQPRHERKEKRLENFRLRDGEFRAGRTDQRPHIDLAMVFAANPWLKCNSVKGQRRGQFDTREALDDCGADRAAGASQEAVARPPRLSLFSRIFSCTGQKRPLPGLHPFREKPTELASVHASEPLLIAARAVIEF